MKTSTSSSTSVHSFLVSLLLQLTLQCSSRSEILDKIDVGNEELKNPFREHMVKTIARRDFTPPKQVYFGFNDTCHFGNGFLYRRDINCYIATQSMLPMIVQMDPFDPLLPIAAASSSIVASVILYLPWGRHWTQPLLCLLWCLSTLCPLRH